MAKFNRKDDEPLTQIQLGVMSPKFESNLLKVAYMESSSTLYGGSDPDDSSDDPDGHVTSKKRSSPSLLNTREAKALRKELRFFFMNPIQKWRFRRRFPWKLLVQIFKIILVTAELVMFANDVSFHHGYHEDTTITLSNLFLKGWATTREVLSYPPAGGPIAVYRQSEFYEYMDYAIVNYAHITDVSMAAYDHVYAKESTTVVPATFCVDEFVSYADAQAPGPSVLTVNGTLNTRCTDINPSDVTYATFSLEKFLQESNFSVNFELLSRARLHFLIEAIRLRVQFPDDYPDCHLINGSLVLDNAIGGSQMVADLDLSIGPKYCHGILELTHRRPTTKVMLGILDFTSLIACFFSIILCARSLHNAANLKKETDAFFVRNIGRPLTRKERWEFLNLWYVTICIDDVLLIVGIFLRLGIATKVRKRSRRDPGDIQEIPRRDPGDIQKRSRRYQGKIQEVSRRYPGGIQEISRKDPGDIQEVSRRYPGWIQERSRIYPGEIQDGSRKNPGEIQEKSRRGPGEILGRCQGGYDDDDDDDSGGSCCRQLHACMHAVCLCRCFVA